jgi:hypothetical protein
MPNANGGEYAPIQSPARPFGFDIWDQVKLTGSDARAAEFNANYLPYFLQLINTRLGERNDFTARDGFKLDPSKLYLRTASDRTIRIYFVHEGAGYHNTLGLSKTLAGSPEMAAGKLLFPNASFRGTNSTAARTISEPLRVGDFIELDNGAPGLQLDFFLIANGAKGGQNVWFNDRELNWDGKQHVVAFLMPNTPYVLIGFEDLPHGGDLDYNDCLFVIDIGETNAENLFNDFSDLPK